MGEKSSDNVYGLILAISSSIFIGSSFIIKKKGLMKAGASGTRAGSGGHSYLMQPMWWVGMVSSEIANFAAYAFAPAILVTPLGALSIIVSMQPSITCHEGMAAYMTVTIGFAIQKGVAAQLVACLPAILIAVLAHYFLDERLHIFGVVGCVLCLVGSTTIVLHAPHETQVSSVKQVWHFATEPWFMIYGCTVLVLVGVLIYRYVPLYGRTHLIVYVGICSLMGSLTVMCVKAVGIAIKLSFSGSNQFKYFQTWFFTLLLVVFCVMQLNYLNKALDTFNINVVSPVYYVMFTSFTILASVIMFKDWDEQSVTQIAAETCGFVTIVCGTFLLHKTKDMGAPNVDPYCTHREESCEI